MVTKSQSYTYTYIYIYTHTDRNSGPIVEGPHVISATLREVGATGVGDSTSFNRPY